MNSRSFPQKNGHPETGIRLAAILCFVGLANPECTRAQDANPAHVVRLEYLRLGADENLDWIPLRVAPSPSPFPKEPNFRGRIVSRGALGFEPMSGDDIRFAVVWGAESQPSQLYLDLNRNRDLTDDPEGVFAGQTGAFVDAAVSTTSLFTNVCLSVRIASQTHPFLVDLSLYRQPASSGAPALGGSARLRSLWHGKVDLQGEPWQVGVVAKPVPGRAEPATPYLLIRPWSAREEPVKLNPGTPHLTTLAKRLFLQGQGYAVACRQLREGDAVGYELELKEVPTTLGELRVKGASIHRMIFYQGQEWTVVLDEPKAVVRMPTGDYTSSEFWLRGGTVDAFNIADRRLSIHPGQPVDLTVGGPLVNRVRVQRNPGVLALTYELTGADSLTYRTVRRGADVAPSWVAYQGSGQVGNGRFEFG